MTTPAPARPRRDPARAPAASSRLDPRTWLAACGRPLTTRGRVTLAVGCLLTASAFLGGHRILLRLGILLVAIPLVCLVVVGRARHQLHCSRRFAPPRVRAGEHTTVTVRVFNDATAPSKVLLAEDQLAGLEGPARFVVERIDAAGDREAVYRTRARVRGRYPIGPLRVRVADPFGMCERGRPLPGVDHLIVVPAVETLAPLPLTGSTAGSSVDSRPTTMPAAGDDDIGTREYRHGDPLHRVHWRATARRDELMVRQEEQPRQSRATVLLDVRAGAHRGPGPDSSLEWAVSACASVSAHLVGRGFGVRVLVDKAAGERAGIPFVVPPGPGAETPLLDALAVLDSVPDRGLHDLGQEVGRPGAADTLLIAILGDLHLQDAEDLARRRPRGATAVAFLLRPVSWERRSRSEGTDKRLSDRAAVLRNGGWRTVVVEYGDTVASAWQAALGGPAGAAPPSTGERGRAGATGRTGGAQL